MGITLAVQRKGRDREEQSGRLSTSLRWFAWLAAVATTTGTLLFCYEQTLGPARNIVAVCHDISGDAAVVFLAVYLWRHVQKTWRMRRSRSVSWWTGVAGLSVWACASITGVYGQMWALEASPWTWWGHALGSFGAIVLMSVHVAYGYRATLFRSKEST